VPNLGTFSDLTTGVKHCCFVREVFHYLMM
jgi:hypothetical protein